MVSLGSYNHYCTNHKNLFHLIDQKETQRQLVISVFLIVEGQ
jgi:hypothetical protein